VIVTTASLDVCAFEAPKVVAESGELAYDDARLTSTSWVLYEYGLPRHLQVEPASWQAAPIKPLEVELVTRMPIFVVSAQHLPDFLKKLRLDYGFLCTEETRVHTALPEDVRNR
jgi:hypothetical protein